MRFCRTRPEGFLPRIPREAGRGFLAAAVLMAVTLVRADASTAGEEGLPDLVVWKAGRCEVVDERGLEEAFRAYLRSPALPAEEVAPCVLKRREMSDFLGKGSAAPPDLGKAWVVLGELTGSPADPDARELFRAVLKASLLIHRNTLAHPQGEALRRREEILSWNVRLDRKKAEEALADQPPPKNRKGHPAATPTPPLAETPGERELDDIRAELARMELGGEVGELQARLELQDLAMRFLRRGDPEASILAVRWYRGLFGDPLPSLRLGPDVVAELVEGDSATLLDLENTASRALEAIASNLASASQLTARNATGAAARSLSAAFAQGARSFLVLAFPVADRKRILQRIEGRETLTRLIREKNFGEAEELWNRMAEESSDFDGHTEIAIIRSGKALSALHLGEALQALEGDAGSRAASELEAAADAWPLNPEIAAVRQRIDENASFREQASGEFDRLHAAGDFLSILGQEARFRTACGRESVRTVLLTRDLEKGRRIREGMETARRLRSSGLPDRAWETAWLLAEEFPGQREVVTLEKELRFPEGELARGIDRVRSLETALPGPALAVALSLKERFPESPVPAREVQRLTFFILGTPPVTEEWVRPEFH